ADSIVVAPIAADQAPSAEETKPFETDEFAATPPPHPSHRTTARISIPAPVEESPSAAAARPAGGFRADYGFVADVEREIMHDPEREITAIQGQVTALQTQVATLQGQQGQQGLAGDP
nr:hypothetical protein [Tanacetum cinerariifolium]